MSHIPLNQLIFAKTYNLKPSFTKQIIIGAELKSDRNLTPIVTLTCSHPRTCISMLPVEWRNFQQYFTVISLYFDGQYVKLKTERRIEFGNFRLRFTILNDDFLVVLEGIEESTRTHYTFSMRKTTFNVLREVLLCMNQHLQQLQVTPLNMAKKSIVKSVTKVIVHYQDSPSQ